jgi:hypothetical protein
MIKRTPLLFAMLFLVGISMNADEVLCNGGFERPITDDLSQEFQLNQQEIPGWKFSGGGVSVVNHTRLLPGEGFQSLLLPCSASTTSAISQEFSLKSNGPVHIRFKMAASKAVNGQIEITLDGRPVKTFRLSEFWRPDEIALTDQMRWQLITLPPIDLAFGGHILGFRVLEFQPRNDHQGDTRSSIQGVLLDAVSVQCAPFDQPDRHEKRAWPLEKPVTDAVHGPLSLDEVAGPWVNTRTLACYPSVANFYGALRSTKELSGIQYLHFVDVGEVGGVINAVSVNGQPVFCDESRWYPYQVCTRAQVGPLDIWSTTRMVFAGHGVLSLLALTNQSDQTISRTLAMNLQTGQTVNQPDPHTVVISGLPTCVYHFAVAPVGIVTTNGETYVQWMISLPPHAGQEISLALALEKTPEQALQKAQRWGEDFGTAFTAAKKDWERRWQAVFTPGNAIYSGCLPTLETDDRSLRELYYLSVVSLVETERDNFPAFKQCFVGEDPEWGGDVTWFWDYSLTSLPYALLNPEVMKNELRHWLTIDWKTCSHFSLVNGKPDGNWYAVNPYAYFLSIDRYLTVTGDFAFLSEKINGRTVLDYLETLTMDWQRLVPKDGKLADIGGNSWNMLEAPPNYVHTVASINAANIWMMRRLAHYQAQLGHLKRADDLRSQADALVPELLKLYNPKTGSWNVLYPDGRQIDSRHIYDYLTVGTTISEDLNPSVKTGMMDFVDHELMTKTWMRAMSRQDPSAFDSDRSDHGPAGSYSGWPAKAAQATAELGRFNKALDMFHRFREAFNSAIPQAIELTKVEGQDGLQARASTRAGASFAEVSGSFAEVVINTFFGFRPGPGEASALWQATTPRGFNGRLRHVHWSGGLYTIVSDDHGLHLEKE